VGGGTGPGLRARSSRRLSRSRSFDIRKLDAGGGGRGAGDGRKRVREGKQDLRGVAVLSVMSSSEGGADTQERERRKRGGAWGFDVGDVPRATPDVKPGRRKKRGREQSVPSEPGDKR